MAISINPLTFVISIPKTDMSLVQSSPFEIRELDINAFRLELKAWEDDEGITFQKTHNHNTEVTISGVILARVVEILEPYTITFEDGNYAVNLIGANSNISDKINLNSVSVRSANSAGLTTPASPSDIASAVWSSLIINNQTVGTMGSVLKKLFDEAFGKWVIDPTAKTLTTYEIDGISILQVFDLTDTTDQINAFLSRTPQ